MRIIGVSRFALFLLLHWPGLKKVCIKEEVCWKGWDWEIMRGGAEEMEHVYIDLLDHFIPLSLMRMVS